VDIKKCKCNVAFYKDKNGLEHKYKFCLHNPISDVK
jgi:hypothetical protein